MVVFPEHLRNLAYRDFVWFHDTTKLINDVTLGWFKCSHDPLPKTRAEREEVDQYFIEEMKLEAKGWRSISIGQYSEYEAAKIAEAVARFPKQAHMSRITEDQDIFPIVGIVDNPCFCVTVKPELIEHFATFLARLIRPHAIVTRQPITEDVLAVLPDNHRIVVGSDATAISYDRVSPEAHAVIVALHDNDLRSPSPRDLKRQVSSSNSSTLTYRWITTTA